MTPLATTPDYEGRVSVARLCERLLDRFPVPKSLWQIPPLNAGLHPPDDGIDEVAVAALRRRSCPAAKQRFDAVPLRIGQFVSSHKKR